MCEQIGESIYVTFSLSKEPSQSYLSFVEYLHVLFN